MFGSVHQTSLVKELVTAVITINIYSSISFSVSLVSNSRICVSRLIYVEAYLAVKTIQLIPSVNFCLRKLLLCVCVCLNLQAEQLSVKRRVSLSASGSAKRNSVKTLSQRRTNPKINNLALLISILTLKTFKNI